MDLTERRIEGETVFHGRVIDVKRDRVLLPGGHTSTREVVDHPGGVCVLALRSDGTVPLVRQYRYPIGSTLLELPAGKLERGEEPMSAAVRELGEEVGLIPGRMTDLGFLYVSPGISTEKIWLYLARDLTEGPVHPDEDEFLEIEHLPLERLCERVLSGEINDGKTACAVLKTVALLAKEGEQ